MTAFSAVRPSAIKLKTVTRLGATVEGGLGIDVDKANGEYTVDLNYGNLPEAESYDPNSELFLVYNPVDGSHRTAAVSTITLNSGTVASQPEAEAGVDNTKMMTPLRTTQHYEARQASQAEAETGTENTKWLSSLRAKQAIDALRPPASEAEAEAGSNNTATMTPLRTRQAIAAFRYVANVKDPDFGAVGDGVADDSIAIQAAFNSGAEVIHIPAGTYLVSNLSLPASGIAVYGDGMDISILKLASGSGVLLDITSLDDILVRDITLDANNGSGCLHFHNSLRCKVHRVGAKNTSGTLIGLDQAGGGGCHYGEIIGCRLENSAGHGVYVSLSNNVRVNDNFGLNIAWAGIDIAGGSLCAVNNNNLSGVAGSGAGSGFGGVRISNQCFNCTVSGNTIYGFTRGVQVIGASYCSFTGNVIYRCNGEGIHMAARDLGGGTQTIYNTVSGNTIFEIGIAYDTTGVRFNGILYDMDPGNNNTGNVTIGNTIVTSPAAPLRMLQALEDTTTGVNVFEDNTTNGTLGP